MKRTGIFYHPVCAEKAYFPNAMSVREGFGSLEKSSFFSEPNVILFESEPISQELTLKVHTKEMVEIVKQSRYYETSLYSVGGSLGALQKVLSGEIDNALVFMGVGGHHSGRNYFGGGCFFNTEAIPIAYARETLGVRRFAVVDTDTHHANGTMDIFNNDDEELLYICFCGGDYWGLGMSGRREDRTNVCLAHGSSDEEEIENMKKELPWRIEKFKPGLIYWMFGLDSHKDSYGTEGLTEKCYPKLAELIKGTADDVCSGRLVVVNTCNAPAHVTQYVMPRIVDCLAELGRYT